MTTATPTTRQLHEADRIASRYGRCVYSLTARGLLRLDVHGANAYPWATIALAPDGCATRVELNPTFVVTDPLTDAVQNELNYQPNEWRSAPTLAEVLGEPVDRVREVLNVLISMHRVETNGREGTRALRYRRMPL